MHPSREASTDELFDGVQYAIPFLEVDGHPVDELVLRLSGTLKLNRHDADHVALVEGFTIGRRVNLTVMAYITGKAQGLRVDGTGQETMSYAVNLKLETIEAQ